MDCWGMGMQWDQMGQGGQGQHLWGALARPTYLPPTTLMLLGLSDPFEVRCGGMMEVEE